MKQQILTIGLLIFFGISSTQISAQEWGEIGTTWVYQELPTFGGRNYLEYEVVKDTIVSSFPCKKIDIYQHIYVINGYDPNEFYYGSPTKKGEALLRESNDSIFYNYLGEWRLIYDFNMQVDESLIFQGLDSVSCVFPDSIMIDYSTMYTENEIGQEDIDGIEVEYIDVTYEAESNWTLGNRIIKSVGGGRGLVPQVIGEEDCFAYNLRFRTESLICHHTPTVGNIQFRSGVTDIDVCQQVLTSINDYDNNTFSENKITIFPNPISGQYLSLNIGEISKLDNYRIYNLNGMLVNEGEMEMHQRGINIGLLVAGMYFLVVQSNGKYSSLKFVKL